MNLAPTPTITNINNNQTNPNDLLAVTFMSKIIDQSLIENIINISLYQAEFSSTLSAKPSEVTNFIDRFLLDVTKDIKKLNINIFNIPNNLVSNSINLARQILSLREDINARLITYDNVTQHFPKRDIHSDKILQNVKTNRLSNITDFRKRLDYLLQVVQSYNELQEIRTTLLQWFSFTQDANGSENVSIFNLLKQYKDVIINAYNSLSSLKILTKQEAITDYMLLSDQQSLKKVVSDVVSFLNKGYSFYKTGYALIDNNIGGLETSSTYIISGPSNHCKSIFMINLCFRTILNNIKDFQPNDAVLFVTLEDELMHCPL